MLGTIFLNKEVEFMKVLEEHCSKDHNLTHDMNKIHAAVPVLVQSDVPRWDGAGQVLYFRAIAL